MTDITAIFRAGFVRRWHTNPDLAHTCDRLDAHQGRVARHLIAIWPDSSAAAIRYALTHDDGESVVGDVPATYKGAFDTSAAEQAARRDLWHDRVDLSAVELLRIKFCDRLDAYMWAQHHAPHVMDGDGWPECRKWLHKTSLDLDCAHVMRP